jgi:phosphoserine phosphatase
MKSMEYPLVCFDLDGTLVDDTIYIWNTLHSSFKTDSDRRRKAYNDFFAGRITYRQWFEHDLVLLREAGADRDRILRLIDNLKPMTGAHELLHELKDRGHKIAIISGSLDIVVERLFGIECFHHVLINQIYFDERGKIKDGTHTPYDLDGKAAGLHELARREGIPITRTVFIGDNRNDIWVAKAAGLSIAFNCKSNQLRSICRMEVKGKDLRPLSSLIR